MKSTKIISAVIAASLTYAGSLHALVVNFADLTLEANSFYNGGPVTNSNGWSSNGVGFSNSFGGSWSGFAYSNTTDTTTPGYLNQYSAIPGTDGSGQAGGIYSVAYQYTVPRVDLPVGYSVPQTIQLTNTTYAYLSIRDGDAYNTAFEEGDWFNVTVKSYSDADVLLGSVVFYLADYRSTVQAEHYIVDSWTSVDLTSLGSNVDYLEFEFASSDVGDYGINTPTYVALDNLQIIPEPSPLILSVLGVLIVSFIWSRRARRGRARS